MVYRWGVALGRPSLIPIVIGIRRNSASECLIHNDDSGVAMGHYYAIFVYGLGRGFGIDLG